MAEQTDEHPLDHPKVASIRDFVTRLFLTAPKQDRERVERLLGDLSVSHWRLDKVQRDLDVTTAAIAQNLRNIPVPSTEEKQ